jgi:hypothetical protein
VQPGDTWESISSTFIGDPEQTSGIAKINPEYTQTEPPISGEKLYVPLDVEEWVTVDVNERGPEKIAREVYGDERFAEMVTRRCRVGAIVAVPKCVVPVFHDAQAVYEAFFAE